MNYRKVNLIIDDMFNNGKIDEDFINIKLKKYNMQKIHTYQILHIYNIITSLKKNNIAIDGSKTGTGKTYTSACICNELNLEPIIICPKSIINVWKSVCDYFNVKIRAIVNYETIKTGQMYNEDGNRIQTDFLKVNKNKKNIDFEWSVDPKKNIIIFDEAHKCKNINSINGRLLLSTKNICKVMMLSATLSDTIEHFVLFGYMIGLYTSVLKGKNWLKNIIRDNSNKLTSLNKNALYDYIYPNKGSSMNYEDIGGDSFPKNLITSDCYTINKEHIEIINQEYANMRNQKKHELATIIKSRQIIEFYKIEIIYDLSIKYLELGNSVAIFVNFIQSLEELMKLFNKDNIEYAVIRGQQNIENEREIEINKFQTNKVRIIICMIQSGGQSISLHDTSGNNPRVSLISPSYSSIELIQTLGRIYRANVITPVQQKIIYCADTYEVNIANKLKQKLNFINNLSDEDLIF